MTTPGYGTFGNLGRDYQNARQEFPAAVFTLFQDLLEAVPGETRVLDIGCGTGIATRQLRECGYIVSGSDVDADMIAIAKEIRGINYVVAPTRSLPFIDAEFDAATAFSAFHWFTDSPSVMEIQRVLKPGGLFMAVNKNDTAGFKTGYRQILAGFIEGQMPDRKEKYDPRAVLEDAGFATVAEHVFPTEERYSHDEALAYLRSVSLWNLIPESHKDAATRAVEEFCAREENDGVLTRCIDVTVVTGRTRN